MFSNRKLTIFLIIFILIIILFAPIKRRGEDRREDSLALLEGYTDLPRVSKTRHIFILLVGGSMAMKFNTKDGIHVIDPGYLKSRINNIRNIHSDQVAKFTFQIRNPVLDSANMKPSDWIDIANIIEKNYNNYDAFIIIHGTDTMAYTASSLSFMLENLNKTVILTGSMLPLAHARSDGPDNLIQSLFLASHYNIPEVVISFGGYIIRGNRGEKVSAEGFRAFKSTNYPILGLTSNIKLRIYKRNLLPAPAPDKRFFVRRFDPDIKIIVIQLTPAFDANTIMKLVQNNTVHAIVINSYGMGDAPVKDKILMNSITYAVNKNIIVTNCTQTVHGRINMKDYQTGYELMKAGVISSYDMTLEAAVGKLYFLMGQGLRTEEVKKYYLIDLRGELTSEQAYEETTYPSYEN